MLAECGMDVGWMGEVLSLWWWLNGRGPHYHTGMCVPVVMAEWERPSLPHRSGCPCGDGWMAEALTTTQVWMSLWWWLNGRGPHYHTGLGLPVVMAEWERPSLPHRSGSPCGDGWMGEALTTPGLGLPVVMAEWQRPSPCGDGWMAEALSLWWWLNGRGPHYHTGLGLPVVMAEWERPSLPQVWVSLWWWLNGRGPLPVVMAEWQRPSPCDDGWMGEALSLWWWLNGRGFGNALCQIPVNALSSGQMGC